MMVNVGPEAACADMSISGANRCIEQTPALEHVQLLAQLGLYNQL
jgi:hypothetical protein